MWQLGWLYSHFSLMFCSLNCLMPYCTVCTLWIMFTCIFWGFPHFLLRCHMHTKCKRVVHIFRFGSGRLVYCSSTCGNCSLIQSSWSCAAAQCPVCYAQHCCLSGQSMFWALCEHLCLCMQHCNMHGDYLHWWKHCLQSDSCPWHPGPKAWCGPAPPHDCPVAPIHNRTDMTVHPRSAEQGSNEQHAWCFEWGIGLQGQNACRSQRK